MHSAPPISVFGIILALLFRFVKQLLKTFFRFWIIFRFWNTKFIVGSSASDIFLTACREKKKNRGSITSAVFRVFLS
jgi:hypothetical protein